VPGRFQGDETILARSKQLKQLRIASGVLAKRAGLAKHFTTFINDGGYMTLSRHIDPGKPHRSHLP
jgi:hypothetical protein